LERPFPAYKGDEPYVFVSYAHADDEIVYPEIQWLHDQGFNVWYDEGISPGTVWRDELAESIDGSSLFLYFITPQSIDSDNCQREVNFAVDHQIPLLAVHLEETDLTSGMELTLSTIQGILKHELSDHEYRTKLLSGASDRIKRGIAGASPTKAPSKPRKPVVALVLAAVVVGTVVAGIWGWNLESADPVAPRPLQRFTIELPPGIRVERVDIASPLAISADGSRVVFLGRNASHMQLYSRALDELEVVPIRGTEPPEGRVYRAESLFLSPDGEWVAFENFVEGTFEKVPVTGGSPVTISSTGVKPGVLGVMGATWGANGTIVFATTAYAGLMQVPAVGGTPQPLTIPDQGEIHRRPQFLPDGSALVFTVIQGSTRQRQIAVLSIETGEQRILRAGFTPQVTASGHLLFHNESAVWATGFDLKRLEVTSEAVPVPLDVTAGVARLFGVANDGTLVYWSTPGDRKRMLVWVDREGREEPLAADPDNYGYARVSPDGERVAVGVGLAGDRDLWTYSLARDAMTRLTFDEAGKFMPEWSPDGQRIVFAARNPDGRFNLFWKAADGTGAVERLTTSERSQWPTHWSSDGQLLFYECGGDSQCDLATLSMQGEPRADLLLQTEFQEWHAALSPDGRWIAYGSAELGKEEVYVRPFPDVDAGRWLVSTNEGIHPKWGPDGRELFYWSRAGMMAVAVKTEPTFVPGTPEVLFDVGEYVNHLGRAWDVAPDGERFLMIKPTATSERKIVVVQNWFDELERLVPTD
jgi:serine/threonine-protein kinase